MCDACDRGIDTSDPVQSQQWLDQMDARIREAIRKYGWYCMAVEGEEEHGQPGFAYTIGLTGFGHPELLAYGLHPSYAHKLFGALVRKVRSGTTLTEETELTLPIWTVHLHQQAVRFMPVPSPRWSLLWAADAYKPAPIQALQVVWADGKGQFPWEPGYALAGWMQPIIATAGPAPA
jgi:hypothetical protein